MENKKVKMPSTAISLRKYALEAEKTKEAIRARLNPPNPNGTIKEHFIDERGQIFIDALKYPPQKFIKTGRKLA
jgi:hypothetical protein